MRSKRPVFRAMAMAVICLSVAGPSALVQAQEVDPNAVAGAAMPAPMKVTREAVAFAQAAVTKYVTDVITAENAARFGFKTFAEAPKATVGAPYVVAVIRIDKLKAYRQPTDVKGLWTLPKKLWFPVTVQGQTRTKVEILLRKDKFIAGEFGGIRSVQEVARATRELPRLIEAREIEKVKQVALIKVPPLNATFLFVETDEQQFLVPALTMPQKYKLKRDTMYPAHDVLMALQPFAEKVEGRKLQ